MKYLSVCSGIEAATVAWEPLGWEAAAYSEIEAFPSKVLKHHYPKVQNLGDMTKFEEWELGTIDLLVGGTPCQSFSVAGLRKGLDDPRGNLMLTFGAIAKRFGPKWLVWENVPGVLSSNDGRDFATFLGMLAELGYGFAYRVLDAQYFGVAQRRRRVFVVGCLGDWRSAAAVLFERDSLSGNSAPSRETRKRTTNGSQTSSAYGGSNSECADTVTSKWAKGSGGPSGNEGGLFVAHTLRAKHNAGEDGTGRGTPLVPVDVPEVMSTLLSSTAGISRPGNAVTEHETYIPMAFRKSTRAHHDDDYETWADDGVANSINLFDQGDIRTTHAVVQPTSYGIRMANTSSNGWGIQKEVTHTLDTTQGLAVAQPIPLDLRNANRDPEKHDEMNRQGVGIGEEGDPSHTLTSACVHGVAQPIAWDEDLNARENIAGTIIRGGDGGRRDGVAHPIAFTSEQTPKVSSDLAHTLTNTTFKHNQMVAFSSNTSVPDCQSVAQPITFSSVQSAQDINPRSAVSQTLEAKNPMAVAQPISMRESGQGYWMQDNVAGTLRAEGEDRPSRPSHVIGQSMAVRRLTPVECERLQGFPDDYTRIPWRKGETPDGPRYKALGNSMAVPVMAWIGQRIQAVNDLPK